MGEDGRMLKKKYLFLCFVILICFSFLTSAYILDTFSLGLTDANLTFSGVNGANQTRTLDLPLSANVTRADMNLTGYQGKVGYISTCTELQNMNPGTIIDIFYLTRNIDCSATTGWDSGAGFDPITTFNGGKAYAILDGQGYNVTDLFINRPTEDYVGLFSIIQRGGGSGTQKIVRNINFLNADITGKDYTGIVAGQVGGYWNRIEKVKATGTVDGHNYVGGIVGYAMNTLVSQNLQIDVDVTGNDTVGGYSGKTYYSSLYYSYSKGAVTGNSVVGGLCGDSTTTVDWKIVDSFWDTATSTQASSSCGTGATTANMKKEATFTNWGFTDIWDIVEDTTYPFILQSAYTTRAPEEKVFISVDLIWNNTGDFNGTTNTTDDFTTILNNALNEGNCDCMGCSDDGINCSIPFYFWSYDPMYFEYSSINITYTEEYPLLTSFSPMDNTFSNTAAQQFICNSSSNIGLKNITLSLWDFDNSLIYSNTTIVTGITNSTTFDYTLDNNKYYWNCEVYNIDDVSNSVAPTYANKTLVVSLIDDNSNYSNLFSYNYSIELNNLKNIWNFTTINSSTSRPIVRDNILYLGAGDLYAINATDGTEIWNFTTGERIDATPFFDNNILYIGSQDDKIYAINATDGTEIWNFTTEGGLYSEPVLNGIVLYVSGRINSRTYAINILDGTEIWNRSIGGSNYEITPSFYNGILYIRDHLDCHALNISQGNTVWTYRVGSNNGCSSGGIFEGTLFVKGTDSTVRAVYANNGTSYRSFGAGGWRNSPPSVSKDILFTTGFGNVIHLYNTTNGSLITSFPAHTPTTNDGIGRHTPVISDSEAFYYIGTNQILYAFASPPKINITYLSVENDSYNNIDHLEINYTTIDDSLAYTVLNIYNSSGGIISISNVSSEVYNNVSIVSDDIYSLNLSSYDSYGYVESSDTILFTIDTTPPSISFLNTSENNSYYNKNNIFINVSASDTNFKNITYFLYNSTVLESSTNYESLIIEKTFTSLSTGNYSYNATICDLADNCNSTATYNITLLNPFINVTSPTQGGTVSGSVVTLDYNISEGCSDANYTVRDSEGVVNNNLENINLNCSETSTTFAVTSYSTFTLYINATDSVGNLGTEEILFTTQQAASTVVVGGGGGGGVVNTIQAVAVIPTEDFKTLTDLQRAIIYARILEIKDSGALSQQDILDIQNNLTIDSISLTLEEITILNNQIDNLEIDNIKVTESIAEKYGLLSTRIIIEEGDFQVSPQVLSGATAFVCAREGDEIQTYRRPVKANKLFESCQVTEGNWICEVSNDSTTAFITYEIKEPDFFIQTLEGEIKYISQNGEVDYTRVISLNLVNYCAEVKGTGIQIIWVLILGGVGSIILIYYFYKKVKKRKKK